MIITRILVDRLNSDPSKSVKLQLKFLLETNSSLIGQFLNWYMIYMLNKVHKYLKKSSTNYFLLKICPDRFTYERLDYTQPRKKETQGFYKQAGLLTMNIRTYVKKWFSTKKIFFYDVLFCKSSLSKVASIKTNKIKKRTPLLITNFLW